MFQMKPIARQVLFACGGLASAVMLAAPVAAQTPAPAPAPAAQPQTLERVTITGSNIRRTDTETVAPVQIITREELERSGKPTVAEALRSIPGNSGNSFDESFSNSFAPGASGIALRGLGQKTTLVLINSRRVAGYGFAQNLQDTFVDLNSIPTSAVERIEILKDGASAIYGSDAIAGVVNVILRRDFKGAEVAASYGWMEGSKNEQRASVGLGFGDLGSQKFNVFGVFDYFKRDELLLSDTEYGKDRDYRDRDGGRNNSSLVAGGTWQGVPVANTQNGNIRRAVSDCANWGRVFNYQEAVQAGLINLGLTNGVPNQPAALGVGLNQPGNTWCGVDINKALSALPGTERLGLLSRGTFDVTSALQLYAEVGWSKIETEQTFTPPFFNTTALQPTAAGLQPFSYNNVFAPGAAGNPLAINATFTGNLWALGTRNAEIESESKRGLIGAKWSLLGWDLDSALGRSENEVEAVFTNRITKAGTAAMFGTATPTPSAPIGFVTALPSATICNLNSTSSSSACLSPRTNVVRGATSELDFVDTKGSTELGQLPGGAIGFATGLEYRREAIKDRPDVLAQSGEILGQGITATDGSRNQAAIFAELALPLTQQLEAQLALRHDKYSDFGSATTPKVGMKFKASPEFVVRGNWGRGFRAPSLPEISPSVATFFVSVNDGLFGNVAQQISGVFAGNPGLRPEKSRSSTLGLVWEPSNSFNLSLDWYEIRWTDIVGSDSFQSIVSNDAAIRIANGFQRDPVTGFALNCPAGDPRVIRNPDLNPQFLCQVVTVNSNYKNLTSTLTNGVDLDVRYTARTTLGRFGTRFVASYISKFEEEGIESAGNNSGTSAYPRLRASITQDWEQGPYVVSGRVNYIHSYANSTLDGTSVTVRQNPLFQNGTYNRTVPAYATLDLFFRYNINPKLAVSGSILNVTDTLPPYDPAFGTQFYDFTLYDPRGRRFGVAASYRF